MAPIFIWTSLWGDTGGKRGELNMLCWAARNINCWSTHTRTFAANDPKKQKMRVKMPRCQRSEDGRKATATGSKCWVCHKQFVQKNRSFVWTNHEPQTETFSSISQQSWVLRLNMTRSFPANNCRESLTENWTNCKIGFISANKISRKKKYAHVISSCAHSYITTFRGFHCTVKLKWRKRVAETVFDPSLWQNACVTSDEIWKMYENVWNLSGGVWAAALEEAEPFSNASVQWVKRTSLSWTTRWTNLLNELIVVIQYTERNRFAHHWH